MGIVDDNHAIWFLTHLEPDPVDPEGCPGCGRLTVVRVVRAERVALDFTPVAQVSSC